jgi:anti-anti-sigma regulatory factor
VVKTEIRKQPDGTVFANIVGKIDEHFDGRDILKAADGSGRVTLKMDGVRSISSLGVRALEAFMIALGEREVVLEEISAAMANQVTMIPNLLGSATVQRAKLPFLCPACGSEGSFAVPFESGAATAHAPKCPQCGAKMEFDGFSEEYLPRE